VRVFEFVYFVNNVPEYLYCVSPGIENEEGGVGFAKDVHGNSGNN